MKLTPGRALDRLVADQRCLGAAFTTYTFDASFFEEHVLAAVLRLTADPETATAAYHDEALAALQETPVVCFVDASMRPPGHRLPFDLREVSTRTFHPKVALLLYDQFARLSVASGNLTKQGYGGNAETFFVHDLAYAEPEHAAVLRDVIRFFEALHQLATPAGTQTRLVLDSLARRIESTPQGEDRPFLFLHTEASTSLLERIFRLVPTDARIERVGVLAPFFERDDVTAENAEDLSSVVLELAKRAGAKSTFDLGVSWDEAPIAKTAVTTPGIADHLGALWALRRKQEDGESVSYFVPVKCTTENYRTVDDRGISRMEPRQALDKAVARGDAWVVGRPRAFAPKTAIETAQAHAGTLNIWLHPRRTLDGARVLERPLHSKLLTITYTRGKKTRTLVVVGSANASRMALLRTPEMGGNVEACVAFLLEGEETLRDLTPELTYCAAPVEWVERTFEELPAPPAIPLIAAAVYEAKAQRLRIEWAAPAHPVGEWTLSYLDNVLDTGTAVPTTPSVFAPFHLSASNCEVVVRGVDGERSFPIVVDDLTALPFGTTTAPLGLKALLALMGRHISVERYRTVAERHGRELLDATLSALLGESFSPTDVFRAWWAAAESLADDGISLAGFRLRLLGAIGPAAAWQQLRKLAGTSELRREEAWFYGAELRRTLLEVSPAEGPDLDAKRALLDEFLQTITAELDELTPGRSHVWVQDIVRFYTGGAS